MQKTFTNIFDLDGPCERMTGYTLDGTPYLFFEAFAQPFKLKFVIIDSVIKFPARRF